MSTKQTDLLSELKETVPAGVLRLLEDVLSRVETLEQASGLFATDKDLDGPYGDPVVKFTPRSWRGHLDFRGKQFSKCAPEFLDALAEALAYSAAHPKEGAEKFVKYNLADAARARSWARRIRSGQVPAAATPAPAPDFQSGSTPAFDTPDFAGSGLPSTSQDFGGAEFVLEDSSDFKDDSF